MSKRDSGKYKPTLIYKSLLQEISAVREYGIEKYGSSEDWLTTGPIRHFDAAIRHIRAFIEGDKSEESECIPCEEAERLEEEQNRKSDYLTYVLAFIPVIILFILIAVWLIRKKRGPTQ